MPNEGRHALEPYEAIPGVEALPGERVVWQGRPRLAMVALSRSVYVLMGLGFLAGALFAGPEPDDPDPDAIERMFLPFRILFVAVGAFVMTAPARAIMVATNSRYVVTDRRAIVRHSVEYWRTPGLWIFPRPLERRAELDDCWLWSDVVLGTYEYLESNTQDHSLKVGFLYLDRESAQLAMQALD